MKPARKSLTAVFNVLFTAYGPQHWWPGDTPFEIMVGAVLTQNTAWSNVEKALANLVRHDRLSATSIIATRKDHLANWLRPSGYFNIKAERLKNFCRWYVEAGGFTALSQVDTHVLRDALLSVNGVGPETADDILLYAFDRPVFVIDAYTRRLFSRLGTIAGDEAYEELRLAVEDDLGPDVELYNEFHALIVRHAKMVCRAHPRCGDCQLRTCCPTGMA
ncbi:MAG: endonuclease III domain-containing protein [Gammaproteobacteria bacterium]|nr:endonuclease III domain-containing protein [Gammaproteobacteria bacterium]